MSKGTTKEFIWSISRQRGNQVVYHSMRKKKIKEK